MFSFEVYFTGSYLEARFYNGDSTKKKKYFTKLSTWIEKDIYVNVYNIYRIVISFILCENTYQKLADYRMGDFPIRKAY